jgi:type IV pilus assembly protein PilY1
MNTFAAKHLARAICLALAALPMAFANASPYTFTIANTPQVLATSMPPNVVVTLDDSGSMQWAFVPDALDTSSNRDGRRGKSAQFNPLYYDPTVVYPPPLDPNGNALTSSFTAAPINGFAQGAYGPDSRGVVNLATQYRPTWVYDPSLSNAGDPNLGQTFGQHPNYAADLAAIGVSNDAIGRITPGRAYYYVYDPAGTACSSPGLTNDACYSIRIVGNQPGPADVNGDGAINGEDEKQNFANWYSFYRTRNLATVASASRAFAKLPDSTRVAWQALNTCTSFGAACLGWTTPSVSNHIKSFVYTDASNNVDKTHKENFYRWLFRLPANNATPLRTAMLRAGAYFTTKGDNSPYGFEPNRGVTGKPEYSCRPNFHIAMTDGIWNNDGVVTKFCYDPVKDQSVSCGNRDGTGVTLPDGTAYSTTSSLTRIFRDNNSDSLADIAFYFWSTDLRPDLANKVVPYYGDRSGTSVQQYWNPRNDPANWQHLVNFTVGLGLTGTLNVTSPADIRWGGGTYAAPGYPNLFNGTGGVSWPTTGSNASPGNVYDLWHAAINSRGEAFSAENPQQLSTALQTALNRILATTSASAALATNSTRLATGTLLFQAAFYSGDWTGSLKAIQINADGSVGSTLWDASASGQIPPHNSRNIYTWSGTAGINFTQADLTNAGLWSWIGSADLLNYLRGDPSKELKNTGGVYRSRGTALGDIVNSDPIYVAAENYGYTSLPEGSSFSSTSYAAFLTAKQGRRKMVYVGANDGMLHAFDALTGAERFAYVPNAVIPKLALLSDPYYSHRYFVDGPPAAWDAFIGGAWRTLLIGTTGAGAKSVFALDVTDPDAFGTSKVMWEINDGTAQRSCDAADPKYASDLGFTLGQSVVVRLNSGDWAAVFGNGYESANDRAVLYIVRASDGCLLRKIDTGVGDINNENGLGTPTLYDADGDDVYDYVYAPDLLGNVWKFDLSSTNPSDWKVAFTGTPLFQARNASGTKQPITARVELGPAPQGKSGVVVLFGTGRFFADNDKADTTTQTFYGVWDNNSPVTTTDRSQLVRQTISLVSISLGGVMTDVRDITSNTIDWNTKRGWYVDLPTSGERVIGTAAVRAGRVIFTTMFPSTTDPCDFGGSGWLMEVDARTGGRLSYTVFDTTRNGTIDDQDAKVAGLPLSVGMVKQPLVIDGSPNAIKAMSGSSGNVQVERNRSFSKALGRDSWREVTR